MSEKKKSESERPAPPMGYGTRTSMARGDRPSPKYEITMPRDLWERIDAAAAKRGMSRAAWLREAAQEKLDRETITPEQAKAIEAGVEAELRALRDRDEGD